MSRRPSFRTALRTLGGIRPTADRAARRRLALELADCTAAQRTELTLLAAEDPAGAEVVDILRGQAAVRLLATA